jgi:hypothetical protein
MAPSAVGQKPRAVARAFPADQLLLYSNGVCFIVATIALILYAGNATGRVYYRAFWQIISLSLSHTHTHKCIIVLLITFLYAIFQSLLNYSRPLLWGSLVNY